jgi:hypothetical protein
MRLVLVDTREPWPHPWAAHLGALQHWSLEAFVADELLGCRQGYRAAGPDDPGLFRVFARRGYRIAAAIAIH